MSGFIDGDDSRHATLFPQSLDEFARTGVKHETGNGNQGSKIALQN